MRIIAEVDGTVDENDRPLFRVEIFTLPYADPGFPVRMELTATFVVEPLYSASFVVED